MRKSLIMDNIVKLHLSTSHGCRLLSFRFGHCWNSSTLYDTIEADHFPITKKKRLKVRNKMGTFLGRLDTLNKILDV